MDDFYHLCLLVYRSAHAFCPAVSYTSQCVDDKFLNQLTSTTGGRKISASPFVVRFTMRLTCRPHTLLLVCPTTHCLLLSKDNNNGNL